MYAYALLHMHIQSSVNGVLPRNVGYLNAAGLYFGDSRGSSSSSPGNTLSLHMDYFDRALQGQRNVVSEVSDHNADGICIAAMLIAQVALVHSLYATEPGRYSIPSEWFKLQAAFSTCLLAARPLLKMDSATSILIHSSPPIDNRDLDHKSPVIFSDLVHWQSSDAPEVMTQPVRDTYRRLVVYIESIYRHIAEGEPSEVLGRRILAFASIESSTFLVLLDEHRPRALVILAHLLAISKRLDTSWWIFRGIADYHVRGIAGLVPAGWKWALEWPFKVLETGASEECFVMGDRAPISDSMNAATNGARSW